MKEQILEELKEIRTAIATLAGTSHLPPQEQLSAAALDKAATEFKKLSKISDSWIGDYELSNYFKDAYNGIGKFIREEFGFANYYKHGKSYHYNKAAIQDLAKELKARNVKLSRYMELKADQENLKKKIASAALNKKSSKGKRDYSLPKDLYDINTTLHPAPAVGLIKADIKQLEAELF